jgi:hypothetical protein
VLEAVQRRLDNEFALDAQQLGHQPAFVGVLGARNRLLDRGEPIGDLPRAAQGFCHHIQ